MKNYKSHLIYSDVSLLEGLITINRITDGILCLFVLDKMDRLVGTLTDGDIRRALINGASLSDHVDTSMERNFHHIKIENVTPNQIKAYRINGIKLLPCLDDENKITKIYDLVAKESILPVDAVLMAGGKGERLMPLTAKVPKPLLKVGNKAIIDYTVERLLQYGIEHFHITVNYLADQIESHFTPQKDGIKISCIREEKYLGTIGSVKFIKNFHHDKILVMNSDLFTNIDYGDIYTYHVENKADITVAAIPYSVNVPYGILDMNDWSIKGIKEKPTYSLYANGGIYLINRELFDLIPDDSFFDATDFLELLISRGYKVIGFPLIGYWIDIGKPEDFKKVQELAMHIKI